MLATGYYQILWGAPPVMADGVATEAPFVVGPTVSMAVVPVSGANLVKMPEGTRASDLRTVYVSGFSFKLGDEKTGNDADRIVIGGQQFAVKHVEDWNDAGNFQMLIVELADPREDTVMLGYGSATAGADVSVGAGTG